MKLKFLILILLSFLSLSAYAFEKKTKSEILYPLFSQISASLGAVTLMPADDTTSNFYIYGFQEELARISGYNHDLNGNVLTTGHKPAITLINEDNLTISNVTTTGIPEPIVDKVDEINVKYYFDALKELADITIDTNTAYNGGTIGSPNDYKIVYLKDAKLWLKKDFKGYGILIIDDTNPGIGQPSLNIEDKAAWYGVVIGYVSPQQGSSDKLRIRVGKQHQFKEFQPGKGGKIYGAVLLAGEDLEIKIDKVGDIFFSQSSIDKVDELIKSKYHRWRKWKELE
jgi:hypothetical protein